MYIPLHFLKVSIFIIFFFFTFAFKVYSDTLVSINDLEFISDFEEESLRGIFTEDEKNYLALYLSIDSTIDFERYSEIKREFDNNLASYKTSAFNKLKNTKKVKKVYKEIHDLYLEKYIQTALLSTVFNEGDYQCVSGTMLYSLIFSELNIPFEIKLLPDHAYLVAYPESDYIMVETTNPLKGTVLINEQFKIKFVDYLLDMKLISQTEYETQPYGELYDSYFNKPEVVSMPALASAQYYNMAMNMFQENKFSKAFEFIQKAYLLHPSKVNSYLLFLALAATLEQVSIKSIDYADYLAKLMRFRGPMISRDKLFSLFSGMTYYQLDYEGDVELYEKSYQKILTYVTDSALRADISFMYYFERGRILFNKRRYAEALPFVETAYSIKPNNSDAQRMLLGILVDMLNKSQFDENGGAKMMDKMDSYLINFPELSDNIQFKGLYLTLCLTLMDEYYYNKNINEGEKYRNKFEKTYPDPEYNLIDINGTIVHSYSTAAGYYFGRSNYKKSRELLKKGLHYAPNSYMLLQRLQALE